MTLPGICGPVHPPPTFDAVGAGYQNGLVNPLTATETHVLGATATAILAAIGFGVSGTVTSITCTVGGVSMKQLGWAATSTNFVYLFGLIGPPTGSQSVVGTVNASASVYGTMNSVSYNGVRGFGVPNLNTNAGSTTASNTVNWGPGYPVVVQAMENSSSPGNAFTASTCTSRYNVGGATNSGQPLFIGDTIGVAGSGTSLSATLSSAAWEAIAVPLY